MVVSGAGGKESCCVVNGGRLESEWLSSGFAVWPDGGDVLRFGLVLYTSDLAWDGCLDGLIDCDDCFDWDGEGSDVYGFELSPSVGDDVAVGVDVDVAVVGWLCVTRTT